MPRPFAAALALLLALAALAPLGAAPAAVTAQDAADARAAERAAVRLSRLEAERDFGALYERLHPDSRAISPRAAVVGWYGAYLDGREAGPIEVTGVEFEPWTWGVTGETYPVAATVEYLQPFVVGGEEVEEPGALHLVADEDGRWGWFFGASRAFLDEQIARYGDEGGEGGEDEEEGDEEAELNEGDDGDIDEPPGADEPGAVSDADYESPFPFYLDADVDRFWYRAFAAADRPYDPPDGLVGLDAAERTGCGWANPAESVAFYCPADESIYYADDFRYLVETQVGDFAWVTVVAHEWGHHVQAELGLLRDAFVGGERDPEAARAIELQADCLAGAYTQDADERGWLDPGDIEEALYLTELAGDPPGTPSDDPDAHGAPAERLAAFQSGYAGGLLDCGLEL